MRNALKEMLYETKKIPDCKKHFWKKIV